MKRFVVFVALVSTVSCASRENQSAFLDTKYESNTVMPDKLTFVHDGRIDAREQKLELVKNSSVGTYEATWTTGGTNQVTGAHSSKTQSLGSDLLCQAIADSYSCSVDKRPVDGTLVKLNIIRNGSGNFDVTRLKCFPAQPCETAPVQIAKDLIKLDDDASGA